MIKKILEELDYVELTYPFDEQTQVYKVGGKMFMLTDYENSYVSLKNTPDKNDFLKTTFAEINPGYHLNKEHWITVSNIGALPPGLLKELVVDSYELVYNKLTKKVKADLLSSK